MKIAVIIIGHDSDASLTLTQRALSERYGQVVSATLSDLDQSLRSATDQIDDDIDSIIVIPYTIELDSETLDRLESAVDRARETKPKVRLGPQIGFDRRLTEIIEDRVTAASNESRTDLNVPMITVERQNGSHRAFSFAELQDLPGQLDDIGKFVPDRSGEAVSVDALLSAAGIDDQNTRATFKSGDDFSADVDIRTVRENGWLVFRLDGAPLPARYGGPLRLLIPGLDDRCANVKSVDRIVVS